MGIEPGTHLGFYEELLFIQVELQPPAVDHMPGGFSDYLLPGVMELPEIESVTLEYPSVNGPYGVKGFGEMTANSPIPAIVNAIYNAVGVRITNLPVTPEKVLRALEEKAAAEG